VSCRISLELQHHTLQQCFAEFPRSCSATLGNSVLRSFLEIMISTNIEEIQYPIPAYTLGGGLITLTKRQIVWPAVEEHLWGHVRKIFFHSEQFSSSSYVLSFKIGACIGTVSVICHGLHHNTFFLSEHFLIYEEASGYWERCSGTRFGSEQFLRDLRARNASRRFAVFCRALQKGSRHLASFSSVFQSLVVCCRVLPSVTVCCLRSLAKKSRKAFREIALRQGSDRNTIYNIEGPASELYLFFGTLSHLRRSLLTLFGKMLWDRARVGRVSARFKGSRSLVPSSRWCRHCCAYCLCVCVCVCKCVSA